jgi:hypothetical protein
MINTITYGPDIKISMLKAAYTILSNPDACSDSGITLKGIQTYVTPSTTYLTTKEYIIYDLLSGEKINNMLRFKILDRYGIDREFDWIEMKVISIKLLDNITIEIMPTTSYDSNGPSINSNLIQEGAIEKEGLTGFAKLINNNTQIRYRIETRDYPLKYKIMLHGLFNFCGEIEESEYTTLLDAYEKSLEVLNMKKYDNQKNLEKNIIEFLDSIY